MAKDTKDKDLFDAFKTFDTDKVGLPSMGKHMDVMRALQKVHYDTFQALLKLQNDYLKKLAEEWAALAKYNVSSAPMAEKAEAQTKIMKETIEKSVGHLKEIGTIIQKNQKQSMDKLKQAGAKKTTAAKKPVAKKPAKATTRKK